MAVLNFIKVAPTGNGSNNTLYAATLAAGANSGVISLGADMIVRIVATGNITVRFGTATNLASNAATATDILVPANQELVIDLGHQNNAISIYSFAASTIVTVNQVVKN